MRVLLTGASGYLGQHLLGELVAEGHEVTALVRASARLGPFAQHPQVRPRVGDLARDDDVVDAIAGQEGCVHAALVWGDPGDDLELRDVVAAAKLFAAAGRAGVGRCVLVSSTAVHRPFTASMGEDDCLATADLYGATKAAGELFLRAACAAHGMDGVAIRPGPIVGPPAFAGGSFRSDRRIEQLVEDALARRPLAVPPEDGRQFSDVRAVSRAVSRALVVAAPHPTYLCVDRDPVTWGEVAEIALAAASSTRRLVAAPAGPAASLPRFRADRVEALLGGPIPAREALKLHVAHMVACARR